MTKIRTGLAIALAFGVVGCKKKKEEPAATPTTGSAVKTTEGSGSGSAETPKVAPLAGKDLAAKYIDCVDRINSGKLDTFKSDCITADFVAHQADMPDATGADATIGQLTGMRTTYSDLKMSPQLVFVNGRTVYAVELMTGTHDGVMGTPMGEIAATKKKVGFLYFHKLALNDENKATEEWWYGDPGTIMGQIGKLPKEFGAVRPAMDKGIDGAPVIIVAADDAKEKTNLDAVKKLNEAFNGNKMADELAGMSDDIVESDQAGDTDTKGKKDLEAGLKMFHGAFPDAKVAVEPIAAGDYVIQHGTLTGTHKGPQATGKAVKLSFAEVFMVKDGKVSQIWRFRNSLALAQQLGMMPAPKDGGSGDKPADKPSMTEKKPADTK